MSRDAREIYMFNCAGRRMLALSIFGVLACATPSSAAVNGFAGGDGDQAATCGSTPTDWQCLDPSHILTASDAVGADDDVFSGGSKSDEPDGWSLVTGEVQDKVDVQAAWTGVFSDATRRNFLYAAFKRIGMDGGDAFLGIELNQSDKRWTNSAGASIPCRTDGDVLISYELVNPPQIELFEWAGSGGPSACPDGRDGSFGSKISMPSAGREAAMNVSGPIQNFLSPATHGNSFGLETFGEAALDLQTLADAVDFAVPCQYFRSAQITSRSSSSGNSSLKDHVAAIGLVARACETTTGGGGGGGSGGGGGGSPLAPPAPTIGHSPGGALLATDDVTISGTGQPGTTVTVYQDGIPVGFADVTPAGTWSLPLTDVPDGEHTYTAEATSNTSFLTSAMSGPDTFTIDTGAPARPAIEDAVTVNDVTLTCTGEPGSTAAFYEGSTLIGTVATGPDGAAQLALPDVVDGTYSYSCVFTDTAGNASDPSEPAVVVVDTVAPVKPAAAASADGSTVTLTCTTEPGATAAFYEGGALIGTAVANSGGAAQLLLNDVGDGTHSYTCLSTDAAGNASVASEPVVTVVDTAAPVTPTAGASADGSTVTVSCAGEPGSTVSFYENGQLVGTAGSDANGLAELVLENVAEGAHSYTCVATDGSGNASDPSDPVEVLVDTVAPQPPTGSASGTGSTVTVTCTTEPNAVVQVLEAGVPVGTASSDANGVASIVLEDVSEGDHTYTCVATDQTGNSSAQSDGIEVAVPPPGGSGGGAGGGDTVAGASAGGTPPPAPGSEQPTRAVATPQVGEQRVDMLSGGARASCYAKPFTAYVRMKGARRVEFRIDGRRLAVARKPDAASQYKVRVVPSLYAAGPHKLQAKITFRKRVRKARTVTLRWRRCGDACVSRRNFRIRVKRARGQRVISAAVWVNNKRVKTVRGKRLRAPVRLSGLPRGTFRVKIQSRLANRRVVTSTRKYRTCTPKRGK